jgi:hypothetical protein
MEAKKVSIGNVKTLSTSLNGLKFEDIEFNKLSLFVGANGTGKSFIMILVWICNYIANIFLLTGKSMEDYEKVLQFLFDKSFDNQDFTGKVKAVFENLLVEFEMDNGKVKNLTINYPDKTVLVEPMGVPIYMSTKTRLFSDVEQYFKFKKMMKIGDLTTLDEETTKNLTGMYKIYDIVFMERMKIRISDPNFKINPEALKSFKETVNKEITNITYDSNTCEFTVHEIKDSKPISYRATSMSAGEQSWINMFIQM